MGDYLLLIAAIVFVAFLITILVYPIDKTDSEILNIDVDAEELESDMTVDSILSPKSLSNIAPSKGVSLYRKSQTELELSSGFDYIYIETFRSYREAEKETNISRFKISKSVKKGIHISDSKTGVEYLFDNPNNQLISTEK